MLNVLKRNNVKVSGAGEQFMLFAHGYGCDQHVWASILPAFEKDYRLVTFDYVGAGQSDLTAYDEQRYADLNGYAQDILEICDALSIQNAIYIGHSVSSIIGILASNQRPGLFSKMVLIGPSARYLNDEDYVGGFEQKELDDLFEMMDANYLGWSRMMGPAIMANADRPELGNNLTASFCATDPEIAKRFARVTFLSDNRGDLKKVDIPTLTLQANEDIIAPLEVGDYIHKNLKQDTLVQMKAIGHCAHLSAPEETIAAIKEFI
ncbi:alpha/beta hydrolase [Pedobacter aquatilis]|uniref:alpha/beta fold hydrolase n=1 Tax=Pedobacter aquatilis TaxID=351343 RepID=UPI0025B5F207|nr:alpha/beta hydrolase [Pedobacter aquatilis]MDN3588488.1 alpha/beta hydrolase [Pedobacter aquatilis]